MVLEISNIGYWQYHIYGENIGNVGRIGTDMVYKVSDTSKLNNIHDAY